MPIRILAALIAASLRIAAIVAVLMSSAVAEADDAVSYSIFAPPLAANEAITNVEIVIRNGTVNALEGLPVGWVVQISNEPGWGLDPDHPTRISAGMIMGALRSEELRKVHVRTVPGDRNSGPLEFGGTLSTVLLPNYDHPRELKLTNDNVRKTNMP